VKRREFIAGLGIAAMWPTLIHAQRPAKLPTIGFMGASSPEVANQWVTAFVQRLGELGWIDGRTARLPTVVVRPGRPNRAASGFHAPTNWYFWFIARLAFAPREIVAKAKPLPLTARALGGREPRDQIDRAKR